MKRIKFLLTTLLLAISFAANAQSISNTEIKSDLERYCKTFYSTFFTDRLYVENSISFANPTRQSDGSILVEGLHSYKGASIFGFRKFHKDIKFKAYMTYTAYEVSIKFIKGLDPEDLDYTPNNPWEYGEWRTFRRQ